MDEYALIMRHEDGKKIASPEQIQQWMKQTMEWIDGITAPSEFISGIGLPFDKARVVTTKNSRILITNGPFGEIKETLGGLIIIKANSLEEALEVAKACPILQGEGNSVEVRQISEHSSAND